MEADFSQGALSCKAIKDAIENKDVGFVVNCLNLSLDIPRDFHDMPESKLWQIVNNSISAASLITRLALPGMAERRRGAIVNISSGRCFRPCARKAALSASTVREQITVSLCPVINTPINTFLMTIINAAGGHRLGGQLFCLTFLRLGV